MIGWRVQAHGSLLVLAKTHRTWRAQTSTKSNPAYSLAAGRTDGRRHGGAVRVDGDKSSVPVLGLAYGALCDNFSGTVQNSFFVFM